MGWLTLTRRPNQSVILTNGEETIVVKVVLREGEEAIVDSQVRLAFNAPDHWRILRNELLMRREKRERHNS